MYNNGSHSLCYQLILQTLLQNEVKSNVARFSHVQTCLATNQVGAKSEHVARFNCPRQTYFAASDVTPVYGVTPA